MLHPKNSLMPKLHSLYPRNEKGKKCQNRLQTLGKLIQELNKKTIPEETTGFINKKIDEINEFSGSEKALSKHLLKVLSSILKEIEKKLKLVPKNHYRHTWMAIGMAAFGIPTGVAFASAMGNMAFIGIGLPIGMLIGMSVGTGLDKKAFEKGNQLNIDI